MPHFDVVRSRQELIVSSSREDICPTDAITLGGNANERDAPISSLDWEEIGALLKVVPCFIAPEPPVSSVNAFFPLTRHHFVKLFGDPCLAGVVRPSHGTLESALQCTYPMQKYTAEETSEMVRFAPFLPKFT